MAKDRSANGDDVASREQHFQKPNNLRGRLLRRGIERFRQVRSWALAIHTGPQAEIQGPAIERRHQGRRGGGRGGRRRGDRVRSWWQQGLIFAALCAFLRWRRLLHR
jgi:hypothetical protein